MKSTLLELLGDPITRDPLTLSQAEIVDENYILAGKLISKKGQSYAIREGIPRFTVTEDVKQSQTKDAFAYKWKRVDTYDSPAQRKISLDWYTEKYGFSSAEEWTSFYDQKGKILDVGCGSGFSSSLWLDHPNWTGQSMWVGVDISEAIDVAAQRLSNISNTHFVQGDACALPFLDGSFDVLFSEGVLHHTPSTREAILASSRVLRNGGEYHFYVYRKKGAIREFTDDFIRTALASYSDEDAWNALRSITNLGRQLAEKKIELDIPENIPLLGIKSGKIDLQRFIYWNVIKLYWNENLSFDENHHINFDWFRPAYAHRQTAEEVQRWCQEAGLEITWFHEQESGYTVRALKVE